MGENKLEQYWTIRDVMTRLHKGEATVKRWIQKGLLKKTKAGDSTLISESDLQKFLKESTDRAHRAA